LALSAAVVLALGAALLNVRIPVLLGHLVNVVARGAQNRLAGYLRAARPPALRLLGLYCLQGLLTFGYIALLSRVGEQVAASMRKALFISLLRQDVAFYDANRTGQLVNRLTADVQEFKSSFKLIISQGLRSSTQAAGCIVSLYLLSPKLTGLLLLVMPTLVGAGALVGSFLRSLSRRAQEQVAKATGVADEVLGNVRTVRAFAMEDQQAGLYCAEAERSSQLSQRLGLGIAAFQGLSNLALNGEWPCQGQDPRGGVGTHSGAGPTSAPCPQASCWGPSSWAGSRRWRRCWSASTSPRRAASRWTATTSPRWTPPGCGARSSASSARWVGGAG
uniref:ABC transmembrane type-1 domain-containing protein n=1 Tax=Anas zonorhyncha TaxID=75864 RepID=A0A8B9U8T6_9AVES